MDVVKQDEQRVGVGWKQISMVTQQEDENEDFILLVFTLW